MADGWATFGKGVFVALAVAGGVWIGRGGTLPVLEIPGAGEVGQRSVRRAAEVVDEFARQPESAAAIASRSELDATTKAAATTQLAVLQSGVGISVPAHPDLIGLAQINPVVIGSSLASETPKQPAPVLKSVVADGIRYPAGAEVVVRTRTGKLKLELEPLKRSGRLKLELGAEPSFAIVDEVTTIAEIALPTGASGKFFTLVLTGAEDTLISEQTARIAIRLPPLAPNVELTSYSNVRVGALQPVPAEGQPVACYQGFLRVGGRGTPGAQIRLIVDQQRPGSSGEFSILHNPAGFARVGPDEKWEAILRIPELRPGQTARVAAVAASGEQNDYADRMLTFQIASPTKDASVSITKIALKDVANALPDPIRINSSQVDVFWSATPAALDGCAAILLDNGAEQGVAFQLLSTETPAHQDSQKLSWTLPGEGRHELSVALVQGDTIIARSSPGRTIDFRQHGPRPTGVELVNPFQTARAAVIRVAFEGASPLSALAGSTSLQQGLFELKRDHAAADANGETGINISSANYIREQSVVELKLTNGLEADGYTLSIKPQLSDDDSEGLRDIYGNLLGAVPGQTTGKPFTFTFFKSVGEELPSQSRGIRGLTGENAVYPEYTPPRAYPEGFNPSDKVVTRVARLYYFRDAHRVVQLLNRTAQSYGRQAVDQQQQLADNALRNAENSTTTRREAERAAVRAATEARAAEAGLQQAQEALVKAQSETVASENGLPSAERAVRDQQLVVDEHAAHVAEAQSKFDAATKAKADNPEKATADPEALKKELDAATAVLKGSQTKLQSLQDQQDDLVRKRDAAAGRRENATRMVNAALAAVQASRTTEIDESEKSVKAEALEEQNYKTLFRREVAAATADPDTYAKGDPNSVDPVLQVSYSVIGEGEIQLRGPLKGVNMARTLINLIDAPVGQVRVSIHTVQVNGERGERMEPVVERIQRYVDHGRFLTSQAGQMLRNAVTIVAARRSEEAFAECEGDVRAVHHDKYLRAFFGQQFIDELTDMDSEFLKSENKLLTLHSMDSTSMAQALFLMALAKNDVRQEILMEFDRLTTCDLPLAETDYFSASSAKYKFGAPFHKQKFQFLGHNAKFVSLKGKFDVPIADPDTLTPMQREFIRLAQIFKSRLVAEREINQRVMERALIEDRFSDYTAMVHAAQNKEREADREFQDSLKRRRDKSSEVLQQFVEGIRKVRQAIDDASMNDGVQSSIETAFNGIPFSRYTDGTLPGVDELAAFLDQSKKSKPNDTQILIKSPIGRLPFTGTLKTRDLTENELSRLKQELGVSDRHQEVIVCFPEPGENDRWHKEMDQTFRGVLALLECAKWVSQDDPKLKTRVNTESKYLMFLKSKLDDTTKRDRATPFFELRNIYMLAIASTKLNRICTEAADEVESLARTVAAKLANPDSPVAELYPDLVTLRKKVLGLTIGNPQLKSQVSEIMNEIGRSIAALLALDNIAQSNRRSAESSRRPLDHKKFMDMLVDESEDKYIEILEGTRAHTANIDNYLGRIITALDDDFNTQFYHPTFKHIREAGRYWDVQMGQIETTTVLTNNRTFAKVSPQAQMEFDLPKRDILISEAFESAAAAYQDYGALLQDPTFLSLTKMYRGQPASATYGSGMPTPMVRDVLPGLPSATNEQMMIQEGASAPDFPSALESLIPDPAVYKFETGTGFEVRPVIQPDGQAVTFHLNYMYTTNLREPVRADEKHLGRIKRHFLDTDVTLGNFEMREVSKYTVALKASRTARGVPLLEDVPVAGILFRPLPQQQSSLQQNVILSQATIFPTLFDLMGLRWAPAIADLGTDQLKELDFVTKGRRQDLQHRVYDYSSSQVDEFLRIPEADRRRDLYRPQTPIDQMHPNGSTDPGMNLKELQMYEEGPAGLPLQEATSPGQAVPPSPVPTIDGTDDREQLPTIELQSYEVPAISQRKVPVPQRNVPTAPHSARKPVIRPASPKPQPAAKDRPGSVRLLGPQSSRSTHTAESPLILTNATRETSETSTRLLDRSGDDLFAAPELQPVSALRTEVRHADDGQETGKRRWFKLPFLSRSK